MYAVEFWWIITLQLIAMIAFGLYGAYWHARARRREGLDGKTEQVNGKSWGRRRR